MGVTKQGSKAWYLIILLLSLAISHRNHGPRRSLPTGLYDYCLPLSVVNRYKALAVGAEQPKDHYSWLRRVL